MSVGIREDKMHQRGRESWMLCRPGSQNSPDMTDRGLGSGRAVYSERRDLEAQHLEARLGQNETLGAKRGQAHATLPNTRSTIALKGFCSLAFLLNKQYRKIHKDFVCLFVFYA